MTRALWTTAAFAAAVVVLVGVTLPPTRLAPGHDLRDAAVAGAVHVHTNRSDGRGSPDEVAAAAARAGLAFIVFTDHGDATRVPDPPAYRSGVLCLDAVEISTVHGHLLAFGLPEAPYPLGGDADAVLEDVHRLGGVGFAAHPDSPKGGLEWQQWHAELDGLEIINLDTGWRMLAAAPGWRSKARLLGALAAYPLRPAESIAALVANHTQLLGRWDELTATRRLPMVAGVDAHARLSIREAEDSDNRFALALPGYETVFRTMTTRAVLDQPLTGDASADAARVLTALREGASYAAVDAILSPAAFDFSLSGDGRTLRQGGEGVIEGPVTLAVATNAPPSFSTIVKRNGVAVATQPSSPHLELTAAAGPAVYRVEIRASDRPGDPIWLLSNPIYVRGSRSDERRPGDAVTVPPTASTPARLVLFDDRASAEWHTETGPASKAALDVGKTLTGRELQLRYGLPGGEARGEFAAAAADVTGSMDRRSRLAFTIRAAQPMRVSVQLRAGNGDRLQRSVYADVVERTHALPLTTFGLPVGQARGSVLEPASITGMLFAVDRLNTRPGSSGRFWLRNVAVE